VGVVRKLESALVIDEEGNAVVLVKETTGITVENEEATSVAVQTAVHGLVLGNVLTQPEPNRAITERSRIVSDSSSSEAEEEGCCFCVLKWILLALLGVVCLPFIPLFCIYYFCCVKE